ncbi:facilitated trehalose transporter Tret1-like [Galleria mellonella]|uniref:Facilitated trehalose transporter Tret1-like n=1 Tax=Galleria mellonella TaxID=7137 RepID=A0A6J1WVG4_GALME|nr:facilitated trehalose transporter Tret1-like [Galleria mellonella]
MNNCDYEVINANEGEDAGNNKLSRKPLFRQLLVCSGIWTTYFYAGLSMGAPTVFIPQIRQNMESFGSINTEMATWLTSILGFGSAIWVPILSISSNYLGRRTPYRVICVLCFIASILLYYSRTIMHILISELIASTSFSAQITLLLLIFSEYTSPQYRGVFLTLKSATLLWGVWVSNTIGTYFYWKDIALLQIICSLYTIIVAFIIPESPFWLACKGKFEECEISHRWLKGTDEKSEKELIDLIDFHKGNNDRATNTSISKMDSIKNFFVCVKSKEIYKPILLSMLIQLLFETTGKIMCSIYILDLIKEISNSESMAYTTMLILDAITVLALYIGCGLSKILRRKAMLTASTSVGVIFLFFISTYLYMIEYSTVNENKYVILGFLMIYSLGIGCGPMLLISTITCEILPLKFRNTCTCIISMYDRILMGLGLKFSPYIFSVLGLPSAFFLSGVLTSICLYLLNIYLPETKDKTLQEISLAICGQDDRNHKIIKYKFSKTEEILTRE